MSLAEFVNILLLSINYFNKRHNNFSSFPRGNCLINIICSGFYRILFLIISIIFVVWDEFILVEYIKTGVINFYPIKGAHLNFFQHTRMDAPPYMHICMFWVRTVYTVTTPAFLSPFLIKVSKFIMLLKKKKFLVENNYCHQKILARNCMN